MNQCQCLTKKGIRCKLPISKTGSGMYCYTHEKKCDQRYDDTPVAKNKIQLVPKPLPLNSLPLNPLPLNPLPLKEKNVVDDLLEIFITHFGKSEPLIDRLSKMKTLIDTRQKLIDNFDKIKKTQGLASAHYWIKNQTLDEIKMVCHPEKWTKSPSDHEISNNYAKYLVNTCLNNAETLYMALQQLAENPPKQKAFLQAFLVKWNMALVGSCIDNTCDGILEALSQVSSDVTYFIPVYDSSKTKIQNLVEFSQAYKKNNCIDCYKKTPKSLPQINQCLVDSIWTLNASMHSRLHRYLKNNLNDKPCSDGILTLDQIEEYLETYKEYLEDCDDLADEFALWSGDATPVSVPKPKLKPKPCTIDDLVKAIKADDFDKILDCAEISPSTFQKVINDANLPIGRPIFYMIKYHGPDFLALRYLISSELINVNAVDGQNDTLLHVIVDNYGNSELIQLLLENSTINPNLLNLNLRSPLFLAVENGNIEAGLVLIESPKVNINLCNGHRQMTAMMRALDLYVDLAEPILRALLKRPDLDLTVRDKAGQTIFEYLKIDKYRKFRKYFPVKMLSKQNWNFAKKSFVKKPIVARLQWEMPSEWSEWQKICYSKTPKDLPRLREIAKIAKIPNSEILSYTALCAELAKGFSALKAGVLTGKDLNCKNETNFAGDDFAEMPLDQILMDDDGFCFSHDELPQVIAMDKHPFTNKPMKDVTYGDKKPLQSFVKSGKTKLLSKSDAVHKLVPSYDVVINPEHVLEDQFIDLINESKNGETKYFTVTQVQHLRTRHDLIQRFLNKLKIQEISLKYKSQLTLFKYYSVSDYMNFLKVLIQYINEMPTDYRDISKYALIEIFNYYQTK
jgi:hypothetical protein